MSWSSIARAPAWLYALVLFALGLGVGLAEDSLGLDSNPAAAMAVTTGLFVVGIGGAVLYWRRLDEAAREAHKFAWYWGGSAGLMVALAAFVGLRAAGLDPLELGVVGGDDPYDYFTLGVLGVTLSQIAGYTVAWAGWWIARR